MTVAGLMPGFMGRHWELHGRNFDLHVDRGVSVAVHSSYSPQTPLVLPVAVLSIRCHGFSVMVNLTHGEAQELARALEHAADEVRVQHGLWEQAKREAEDVLRGDAF